MRRVLAAFAAAVYLQLNMTAPISASDPWTGSIRVQDALVYDAPGGAPIDSLAAGTQIVVTGWQSGPPLTPDNFTWANIGGGRFLHSAALLHAPLRAASPPPRIVSSGHWADANLTQQILTLYDGDRP